MDAVCRPVARLLLPGLVLIVLACGLGAWVLGRGPEPFRIDEWWNTLVGLWRHPLLDGFADVFNVAGGFAVSGAVVTVAGAVTLAVLRRWRAALYLVTAQIASALAVQVLKHVFGRARPEDILVLSDYGSFPSGHTAAAATLATVAVVLFRRQWIVWTGLAWVVLMAFSRTYLHAHWLSDTLGGALVGAGVALVVATAFVPRRCPDDPQRAAR